MLYSLSYFLLWITILLGLVCSITLNGQSTKSASGWPPLQLLDVDKGLPQSFVSGVVVDEDGFTWVGTRDGLARYDGQHFVTFQHQPNDPTSPIDNAVSKLWKGERQDIWVQYETGDIDRLNTQTGHCWHLTRQPVFDTIRKLPFRSGNPLRVDHQGNLWGILTNNGVFYCDFSHNKLIHLSQATHGLLSDTVKAITEDQQNRLWVITATGISLFNRSTGRFENTRFPFPLASPLGAYNAAEVNRLATVVRTNGDILFGDRLRLFVFNPDRRTLWFIPSPIAAESDIQNLVRSPDGREYIQANGIVYRYTDQQGLVPVWRYKPSADNLSTDLWCTGISFDQSGVMWLGGNTLGLLRLDLAATPLRSYPYQTAFCQDVPQTELGVSLARFFRWPFTNLIARSQSSYLMRSDYDRQGQLWIGLGDQVGLYNSQRKQFTLLPAIPSPISASFQGGLRGLSIAPDGKLWIVTEQGLPYWYNGSVGRWQALLAGNSIGLPPTLTNDLLADSSHLWTTTVNKGLIRFTIASQQVRHIRFGLSSDKRASEPLLDMAPDPTRPHLLWIGSYQGLLCFNKRTQRYQRFTTAQGLPNNTIYSVVPDAQGYLWISTNKGLCRFHPISHTTLTLQTADGLPGDEFNRFHHFRLPNGQLAFGGIKGWIVFDPALIQEDKSQPIVALTELKINNKPVVQYGIHSPFTAPINHLPSLQLPYDQNYLTFEFAALHSHQPDRVLYRYQLLGYDPEWTVSSLPTATYTKLPPGTYTLRVNAANGTGLWSLHRKELSIVIRPPIWASGWAYGLYALLAGFLLIGFVRIRIRRERERHEQLRREQQADELRQLDQAKTRFFANVSHELRTPLTLMLGPLGSVLAHQQLTGRDEQLVQSAQRNAQHLLSLVNELLDLSKLEAGKMELQSQPVRLNSLLHGLLASFESQAQQKGIALTNDLSVDEEQLIVELDERKFRQVITNLLANALKFTPAGGTVHVTIRYLAPQLQVSVSDTGRGILPDDLPHIFDRYFQTQQTDSLLEGGTGIGLALCQELVRLMQGNLWAESRWGEGSTFTVTIPAPQGNVPLDTVTETDLPAKSATPFSDSSLSDGQSTRPAGQLALNPGHDSVLVVEDNPDLRDYLIAILSPSLQVQTAENGEVALAMLADRAQPPSLIISDIMMPVMDGFQLLERLKTHERYRRIPIIMLTARAELADKLRALRIGVDDYLLKPFEEEELIARIAALLHNQRERAGALPPEGEPILHPKEESVAQTLSEPDTQWLERLEALTNTRLSNFELTADELADELAMSRSTFFRTVKRLTGLTPTQYLTEARFRQARVLLETRQVTTVKQVAHQVGFRQVSHFSQTYQHRFGKSPADYL